MQLDLQDRHLFITGGTGFLGKSLLDYFLLMSQNNCLPKTFSACLLSRNPDRFLNNYPKYKHAPWLEFVQGDIHRLPKLNRKVTDVIHGAADTHGVTDRLAWLDQLVNGTKAVLEFAREASVRRFLFLSSGAVYGTSATLRLFKETDTIAPLTTDASAVYAHGKRMAETLCVLHGSDSGMDCVIARCFSFMNPYIPLAAGYAAGNFIRDALDKNKQELILTGHPDTTRSFMDGRDAAKCLVRLLMQGKAGEVYNVGSNDVWPMKNFAQKVLDVLAPGKSVSIRPSSQTIVASHYVPNIDKLTHLLGDVTGSSMDETLTHVGFEILRARAQALESSC